MTAPCAGRVALVTGGAGDGIGQATARKLAGYKVPDEWIFVDRLPRNAMGKVLKTELRSTLEVA